MISGAPTMSERRDEVALPPRRAEAHETSQTYLEEEYKEIIACLS
jgi:hypothetical protein